jgi:FkbM family methyltransferase
MPAKLNYAEVGAVTKNILKSQPELFQLVRSILYKTRGYPSKDMRLLPMVVDPEKAAVDVGAHTGSYTHVLLNLGARVTSIEPNPVLAADLTRLYGRRARILCAAASSSPGVAKLRIPRDGHWRHGLATIEDTNNLSDAEAEMMEVRRVTLDEIGVERTGFLKVDVEGHELDVLLGARTLLQRDHPVVLIEAEERHRPQAVATVCEFLASLDYKGFMLDGSRLSSISNFDPGRDQAVPRASLEDLNRGRYKGRYINNFLFLA